MPETLATIYSRHCTQGVASHGDKGTQHSYIEVYESLLAPYRNGCTLMEIGLGLGLSLEMWREYMPTSRIIGVDIGIAFDPAPHLATGTILVVADATKPEFLDKIKEYRFDVVIDDASHAADDQESTFRLVKPQLNPGGIYVIEDIKELDRERTRFARLHERVEVLDRRKVKGYFADVLIIYRF